MHRKYSLRPITFFPLAVVIKCTGGPIISSVDISEKGPKFKGFKQVYGYRILHSVNADK